MAQSEGTPRIGLEVESREGRGGLGRSVSLRFPADRVCPDVAKAVEKLFRGSEIVAFQKLIEIRHQQNQ